MLVLTGCLAINGCKKASDNLPPAGGLTVLTTTAVTNITGGYAQSGGNITADGGSTITARGVCWSTTPGPTTANSKTTDGGGIGVFTSAITGLTASTTFYVRAYAINSAGTAYGNEVSFTTAATTLTQNVYVAGSNNGVATVWKNGIPLALSNTLNTSANSVFVSGTDVYVAGGHWWGNNLEKRGGNTTLVWFSC